MPPVQFPPERLGHSLPRQFLSSAETRVAYDRRKAPSASSNTLSVGHNRATPPGQLPTRVVPMPGTVKDGKPIHPFRKQSSKDIASLANIITAPPPGTIGPIKRPRPASATPIPSRLTSLPKFEGPNPSETIPDVKKAPHQVSDSNNPVDLSESEDSSAHSPSVSKPQKPSSLALIPPDGIQLSKDRKTRFPGHGKSERVSRSVNRKGLFGSRYEPYRRPQSSGVEHVKWRVGSGVGGKAVGVERELVMVEEGEEGDGGKEGEGKGGDRVG